MADSFKKSEASGKEILKFRNTAIEPTEKDKNKFHENRIQNKIITSDKNNYEFNNLFFEQQKELFKSSDEEDKLFLLSKLHQQSEFLAWVLGDMLKIIDDEIYQYGKFNKIEYSSITDYLNKFEYILGFSARTGNRYISIRKNFELNQFKKIGIRKCLLLLQLKEEKVRDKIIKQVIENKLESSAINEIINAEKKKILKNNSEIKEMDEEKIKEKYKFKIIESGVSNLDLIITCKTVKEKELLKNWFDDEKRRLQLFKMIENYHKKEEEKRNKQKK